VAVTLAVAGLGLWSGTDTANAAPGAGPFTSASSALANAPQGTPMSNYFTIAQKNTAGNAVSNNTASVVTATSPVAGMSNNAVRITTDAQNKIGAIWSTKDSFDLSKNQVASMWIFASNSKPTTPTDKSGDPGDGMAFVLQNAGNTDQFSGAGESLGVWGIDPKTTKSNTQALADTAIPNSWALEFDTHTNNTVPSGIGNISNVNPSAFDLGDAYKIVNADGTGAGSNIFYGAQHLASNYPGQSGSYDALGTFKVGGIFINSSYYYYGLTHLGCMGVGNSLANGTWHHVTMDYTAPTTAGANGSMTYTYDDKNPQTGEPQKSSYNPMTVPIDLTAFNLSGDQTKIRWGFTGSTGDSTESNMVIFDQIPGETKTNATADMTYEKDGNNVAVATDGSTQIPGGSKVTLNYTAQRQSGDADWEGLNAELKIPEHITPGGTAKITYADGSTRNATVTKQSDGYAILNLAEDGSDKGLTLASTDAVKVSIGGQAQNPANGATYSSGTDLTSYFKGTNAVSTATTPDFSITHADIPVIKLDVDQETIHVNKGETPVVTGRVERTDGSPIVNSAISLDGWLVNDKTGVNSRMDKIQLDNSNPASGFKFTAVPTIGTMTPGTYKMTLEAVDDVGNMDQVDLRIIIGDVDFGSTSGDLTYKADLTGSDQTVSRSDPNWSFNIDDTLTQGTSWQLYAKASALVSETTPSLLDGELIYSSDGQNSQPLSPTADTLITDHSSDGSATPFNIAGGWDDHSGILLKVNGDALQGEYKGTVTWTLADTIDAN